MLSVIVPVFNEEEVLNASYKRLKSVLEEMGMAYELIYVNDGSRDKTQEMLEELELNDPNVKLLDFSRNFGHQSAITAGMEYSSGEAIVIIDADLQDPPEIIPRMVKVWREGYDVVYGKRIERNGETAFKRISARLFYRILRSMTSVDIPLDTGDFRLISRRVCDALSRLPEHNRFVRGLVSWVGFKQTSVEFIREERYAGETKYSLRKMIELSISGMASFSRRPLQFASIAGVFSSLAGLIWLIVLGIMLLFGNHSSGTVVIIAFLMLGQGVSLTALGILGEYISRIYDEVRGRPHYVVNKTKGFGEKSRKDRMNPE